MARVTTPDFNDALQDHLEHGWVFSNPHFFIMLKATIIEDKHTWYVHSLAGAARMALHFMPFKLPFISFARNKDKARRLRIYPTDRVQGLLNHIPSTL